MFLTDMSTTAFIEPLPVVEFVAQVLGRDISSRPLSDADRVKVSLLNNILILHIKRESSYPVDFNQVKKALRGVKVEVTHRGNIRRKYRISGLTSQPTRELMYILVTFTIHFYHTFVFSWLLIIHFTVFTYFC